MTRQQRIDEASIAVLFTVPFFGPGLSKLPVSFSDSVDTAATDGSCILINPKFLDSLKERVPGTLLCHETCHPLLGHMYRGSLIPGIDWELWNQACDHEVNLMLKEFSAQVMAQGRADPFPFPEPPEAYCADPRFSGMPAEQIYSILAQERSGGIKGHPQGLKSLKSGKAAQGVGAKHSMPSFGQMQKPKPGQSAAISKALRDDWENTLIQSVMAGKGRGNVPGSLRKLVEDLVSPSVPWWEVLRCWLREQVQDDWSYQKPNPVFDDSGLILPSLDGERIGTVVFGTDWSGSTQGDLVTKFHAEKQECLDSMKPSKLVDIGFDTEVVWEKEYAPGDAIDREVRGGGGTSFVKVFERCAEHSPKCVVILTDLDGDFPNKAPAFPVIWCAYGTANDAPFGDTIHV